MSNKFDVAWRLVMVGWLALVTADMWQGGPEGALDCFALVALALGYLCWLIPEGD